MDRSSRSSRSRAPRSCAPRSRVVADDLRCFARPVVLAAPSRRTSRLRAAPLIASLGLAALLGAPGRAQASSACPSEPSAVIAEARAALDAERTGAALASSCERPLAALLATRELTGDCRAEALLVASRCAAAAGDVETRRDRLERVSAQHPDAPEAADALHELAALHGASARYPEAAAALERFVAAHPRDPRSADALARLFQLHRQLGARAEAEAAIDRFVALFGRTRPHQAARLEWARGSLLDPRDHAGQLAHARGFLRQYGRKAAPDQRALAEVAIGEALLRQACGGRDPARGCFLLEVSASPEATGPEAAVEQARARVEALQRRATLREQLAEQLARVGGGHPSQVRVQHELRVAQRREQRATYTVPRRCGPTTTAAVSAAPRDAELVQRAQAHFDRVLALHRRGGKALHSQLASDPEGPAREAALLDAVARATLYTADAALTGYLALRVPEGLEFHVEEWRHGSGVEKWERAYERQLAARDRSVKRLTAFMTEKRRAAAELTRRYAELAALGVPRWSALASARVGVVHEAFARELERAEVPASFTAEEHYEAYCDALTQRAAPLRRAAAEQYRQCLALATRAGASVEQARACGQALDRLEGTSGEHYEMPVKTSHVELEAAPERVGVVTE